jgi:hypothetical protein
MFFSALSGILPSLAIASQANISTSSHFLYLFSGLQIFVIISREYLGITFFSSIFLPVAGSLYFAIL